MYGKSDLLPVEVIVLEVCLFTKAGEGRVVRQEELTSLSGCLRAGTEKEQ